MCSPRPPLAREFQTALVWTLIDMLFYFLMFGAAFVGAGIGSELGAKYFGTIGGIAGALVGGFLGLMIGRIPHALSLISISNDLGRKSVEDLHASLRGLGGMFPNFVLVELQARGEDIEQHLPFILSMMEAPDVTYRQRGLAALYSAFPDLAKQLEDYPLHGSAVARKRAVERLRKPA